MSEISQLDALWNAGGWLHIPYSAIMRIEPALWLEYIGTHCGDRAKQSAQIGCFPRCIVWVGRKRAMENIKGFQRMLKDNDNVHKVILRARIKSLQFTTKYFSPNLP